VLNLSARTYQRWKEEGQQTADKRPTAKRQPPANKLTKEEKKEILSTCNNKQYVDLTPAQIVPKLADEGIYIASESTFYRVLKEANQQTKRKATKSAPPDQSLLTSQRALTKCGLGIIPTSE
jgi:transposase